MATPSPIPINEKPFYNTDAIANSIAADDMFDCYMEPVPGLGLVTRRRPGTVEFAALGTGTAGDGLFYWTAEDALIGVSNGRIYVISEGGAAVDITGEPLNAGVPVIFASGQDTGGNPWLYMANGKLVYVTVALPKGIDSNNCTWADNFVNINSIGHRLVEGGRVNIAGFTNDAGIMNGTFTVVSVIDSDNYTYALTGAGTPAGTNVKAQGLTTAPSDANTPAATHVTFLSGYFLANDPGTNKFYFTDTNPDTGLMDNKYWSSVDGPL